MKFDDIPADTTVVRVRRTDFSSEPFKEQPVFDIKACTTRQGEFEIRIEKTVIFVKPVVEKDSRRLSNELAAGRSMLSRLANKAANKSFELQIKFFNGECLDMGDIEIGVDEEVEKKIEEIDHKLSGEYLYKYLENRCCFLRGSEAFFFITAGPAIDAEIEPEPEEKTEEKEEDQKDADTPAEKTDEKAPKPALTRNNSFCVTGNNIRFVATETQLSDGKSIYISTRLTKLRNKSDRALRLAKGQLKFVDWTKTGQIQILAKAQLNNLINEKGSYLKKWDEFGDIEGELLLKQARAIDVLHYCDMQQNRNGTVSVRISQAADYALNELAAGNVEELEWIESVDKLPDYLKKPDLKFAEFISGIEKEIYIEESIGKQKKTNEKKRFFKVSDYDNESRILTVSDFDSENSMIETKKIPPDGVFIFSFLGDSTQIKRRITARKLILEGRSVNPQLGLIIEEKGEIAPTSPVHKVKPLSAFVLNKIFDNPPTLRQEEAIEAALSTPDIALIQGPPGTGKTTVIAAILERLNEDADKRQENIKGQVLLTGFQHDAVENMINRRSLNGIPIPKFGKRSGANEDDDETLEKVWKWGIKIADKLRAQNLNIAEKEKEIEIKNLYLQYLSAPTRELAANLAKNIASINVADIGENISRRAAHIAQKLSLEETLNCESNPMLDAVRRLRTGKESFADDGPDRAADALEDLKNKLKKDELDLLKKASLWTDDAVSPPFLKDLAALKNKLLTRFTAPPVFRVEKQNAEVITLAKEAITKIKEAKFSAEDKKSAALAEFLAELESNPYGIIDTVSDYSYAFAATCQQSVNRLMQYQKGFTVSNKQKAESIMEFEYVIVDEAARVSPRDLMVPMAHGKRIILVGDHRQLPHIIDDEVERQMEEGKADEKETEWLKKSMFEYLFLERLKELEKKDGIKRHVTLNAQYRMHPLLGDFVSRNFYERFDPSEKFDSPRPESDFIHNLSDTDNKPAVWLDVPALKGDYERKGTSWIRRAEATAIAKQLKTWMKEREDLSFGVISFYKAQVKYIIEQLKLAGINVDGEKLRVGTVDSFQGMEFDVVFLSMVRTLRENWKPNDEDREKQAHNLFGHLCLYNRLNVSMSRQKKLLAVAGDSGLLKGDISGGLAAEFIPGLVDFYNLCREKGKVL